MQEAVVVYGKCAPLPMHSENLGGLPLHRAAILRCRVHKDARLDPSALCTLHSSRNNLSAWSLFLFVKSSHGQDSNLP